MRSLLSNCNTFCAMVLLIVATTTTPCYMQHVNNEQQPQQQQPPQQPQRSTAYPSRSGSYNNGQWNRQQACEYKELMTSLHDRVSVLATLDEDQRSRLENIDKKIVQFEESNLARLESIGARQMDLQKRLDSMEHIERLTKREVEELRGEFQALGQKHGRDAPEQITAVPNEQLIDDAEAILSRGTRQAAPAGEPLLRPALAENENVSFAGFGTEQMLTAIGTLLASTRTAIRDLQSELQLNITRLQQQQSVIQRRLNSVQRRIGGAGAAGVHGRGPPQTQHSFYATADQNAENLVTSCAQGTPTAQGVLQLKLTTISEPFYVLCEEQEFEGGWTVIQSRSNGDVNFQRNWAEYKIGFGNLAGEFFIGLEKLHALTTSAVHELIILMEDTNDVQKYARYSLFAIGGEEEQYALKLLGKYTGSAGDSLTYHAGSKFSTYDNDNDGCLECNCAQGHGGAWWYNWCEMSNLNGKYYATGETVQNNTGIYWHTFNGPSSSLRKEKMMIRPVAAEQERRRRR